MTHLLEILKGKISLQKEKQIVRTTDSLTKIRQYKKQVALFLAGAALMTSLSGCGKNKTDDLSDSSTSISQMNDQDAMTTFDINTEDIVVLAKEVGEFARSARANGVGEKYTAKEWINYYTIANINSIIPGYLGYSDALTASEIIENYLEINSQIGFMDLLTITEDTKIDIARPYKNQADHDYLSKMYDLVVKYCTTEDEKAKKEYAQEFNDMVQKDIIENEVYTVSQQARLLVYRMIAFMEHKGVTISEDTQRTLYDAELKNAKIICGTGDTDFYSISRNYMESMLKDKIDILRTDKNYDSKTQHEQYEDLVTYLNGILYNSEFNANPELTDKERGVPSNSDLSNPVTEEDRKNFAVDPNTGETYIKSGNKIPYDPSKDQNLIDHEKEQDQKEEDAYAAYNRGFNAGRSGNSAKESGFAYMQGWNAGYADYKVEQDAKDQNNNNNNQTPAPTAVPQPTAQPTPAPTAVPQPTEAPSTPAPTEDVRPSANPGDPVVDETFEPAMASVEPQTEASAMSTTRQGGIKDLKSLRAQVMAFYIGQNQNENGKSISL